MSRNSVAGTRFWTATTDSVRWFSPGELTRYVWSLMKSKLRTLLIILAAMLVTFMAGTLLFGGDIRPGINAAIGVLVGICAGVYIAEHDDQ